MIVTEKGMYWTTGTQLIKVQKSRTSGMLYGKALKITRNDNGTVSAIFEYAPGILKMIDRKMTFEEAVLMGKEFGFCCVCSRMLTNARSIELGIGPVCRGYF